MAAVFRLENSRSPESLTAILGALVDWLGTPEQTELRRDLAHWLQRVLLPRRIPRTRLPEFNDLSEVQTMLAERVQEWTKQWRDEGWTEGVQAGEAALLLRQLERRFGPLTDPQKQRVQTATSETLLLWGDRVLTARSIDEVFQ